MTTTERHGLGDPRIAWTVLLEARLTRSPGPADLEASLTGICRHHGWPSPRGIEDAEGALTRWSSDRAGGVPLRVASSPGRLVLAADHRCLDGLGMLTTMGDLLGEPLRSGAHGVGTDRPHSSLLRAGVRRSFEIVSGPAARIPETGRTPMSSGDSFAVATIAATVPTARLAWAAARVISEAAGGRRPVSLAIGVSTDTAPQEVGDHSAYLRLTGADHLDAEAIAAHLASAPVQPGGEASSGPLGRVARIATRIAAARLGSTLLVSHLGTVTTDTVDDLAFYPVSGGTSGLSLGAATVRSPSTGRTHTTLTLRGRAAQHSDGGLHKILEATIAVLTS